MRFSSDLIDNRDFPGGSVVFHLNSPANAGDGMATHFSILAWRIPRTEEPGRLQSMGSQKESNITWQLNNNN